MRTGRLDDDSNINEHSRLHTITDRENNVTTLEKGLDPLGATHLDSAFLQSSTDIAF